MNYSVHAFDILFKNNMLIISDYFIIFVVFFLTHERGSFFTYCGGNESILDILEWLMSSTPHVIHGFIAVIQYI